MEPIPQRLIKAMSEAESVAVLTGAGVSAESGLPTFRDAMTGLWANFKPEDLATPEAFQRDPKLVWEWYEWRRSQLSGAAPNPAHFALTQMQRCVSQFTLVTQNVDGLHQQAGSQGVLELHGRITRTKCFRENILVEHWDDTADMPPLCPHCGGPLRPDVVWFGESLPVGAIEAAVRAAENCDVFLSIGTSGLVYPAAALIDLAAERGATTAIFNMDATGQEADFHITGLVGQTLPALMRVVWPTGTAAP